jgi:hypothetical protein
MEPNTREVQLSQVACLLDELDGKSFSTRHWDGYHPKVYSKFPTEELADQMVEQLCSRLQTLDVTKYSLEMQTWWRDHQKADKERLEKELEEATLQQHREAALAKLTPYEKGLLGL